MKGLLNTCPDEQLTAEFRQLKADRSDIVRRVAEMTNELHELQNRREREVKRLELSRAEWLRQGDVDIVTRCERSIHQDEREIEYLETRLEAARTRLDEMDAKMEDVKRAMMAA